MVHEKLVSKMSRCVLLSGEMRSRETGRRRLLQNFISFNFSSGAVEGMS